MQEYFIVLEQILSLLLKVRLLDANSEGIFGLNIEDIEYDNKTDIQISIQDIANLCIRDKFVFEKWNFTTTIKSNTGNLTCP